MGGVINIITRKPSHNSWQGNLKIEITRQNYSYSDDIEQQSIFDNNDIFGLQPAGNNYHREEDKIAGGFTQHLKHQGNVKLSFIPSESQTFAL